MSSKRYFFVHLAIFAAICCVFAVAGISSFQDYQRAQNQALGQDPRNPMVASQAAVAGGRVLAISAPFGAN